MRLLKISIYILFLIFNIPMLHAQTNIAEQPYQTAEQVIRELYDLVTFEPNNLPDWEKVKATFIENPVFVLRTARDKIDVMSMNGFIDLWLHDIKKYNLDKSGFQEKIVNLKIDVFGDIAHGWVLYEASIPNHPMPPQQGVDSFQLMKKDGRWWIVSITNEIPGPGKPIPEYLRIKEKQK